MEYLVLIRETRERGVRWRDFEANLYLYKFDIPDNQIRLPLN